MTSSPVSAEEGRGRLLARIAEAPSETRTNHFNQQFHARDVLCVEGRSSTVLLVPELGFHRVYWATRDVSELSSLLRQRDAQTLVTANLAKVHDAALDSMFETAGFRPYATYRRMLLRQLPPGRPGAGELAAADDAMRILELLRTRFDHFTDHLPTEHEVATAVERKSVLLQRNEGEICGFVYFSVDGSVFNFNYLLNDCANPIALISMLYNFYTMLGERGVRRGFLWADERKAGVIRMHERFGWKADGLLARYFVRTP